MSAPEVPRGAEMLRCGRCDALAKLPEAFDAPQEAFEYYELTGHFSGCPNERRDGRAGAARANELANALERAAAVASDAITGPVEVPITSGMMREAAALLRSRAAPLDRERLVAYFAGENPHFLEAMALGLRSPWEAEQRYCADKLADAVLAAHATPRPEPPA